MGRYVNNIVICDVLNIGWLPIRERRDFHILKLVYKALFSSIWPWYVALAKGEHTRTLCSSIATRLVVPLEKDTFQDAAANLFNALPPELHMCDDFKLYCKGIRTYLLSKYVVDKP